MAFDATMPRSRRALLAATPGRRADSLAPRGPQEVGHVRRILAIAVVLAAAASVVSSTPVAAKAKERCPDDKPLVVDVTRSIDNLADYGVTGQVWALDDLVERVRIYEVGTNYFCVRFDDVGTFTSFAGLSPGATGTISAGVTGKR